MEFCFNSNNWCKKTKKKHRPNVLENTSLTTAISVCCQLEARCRLLISFSFHRAGILWTSCQMLAKCFPQRMRAMFGELKGLGGVIEVLPTIIEKSSFVFCFVFLVCFYLFIFLFICFGWKRKRLEWWSTVNQMHHPLFCSLLLEIIPVYFGNSSQKLCCHSYLSSDGSWLHYMQIISAANEYKIENVEWSTTSQSVILYFLLRYLFLSHPLCFCLVWCPDHFNVKAWAHSHCVPDISLWTL